LFKLNSEHCVAEPAFGIPVAYDATGELGSADNESIVAEPCDS
jgi:hypothetical protein